MTYSREFRLIYLFLPFTIFIIRVFR